MKKYFLLLFALTVFVFASKNSVKAQVGGPSVPGADPFLLSIFKDIKEFSAPATINIKKDGEALSGDIDFAYSDGKIRISLDMTKFKGEAMAPEAINILKQMGMDTIVSISGTSAKEAYVIYPSLKSFVVISNNAEITDPSSLKIDKTELGDESIDKQKCKKNKLVATDKSGKKQEAIVWYATNLKNFPLQIKISDPDNEVTLLFKNPKLEAPSADLFKVPQNYKKYNSMQELMKSAMEQALKNGGGMK